MKIMRSNIGIMLFHNIGHILLIIINIIDTVLLLILYYKINIYKLTRVYYLNNKLIKILYKNKILINKVFR